MLSSSAAPTTNDANLPNGRSCDSCARFALTSRPVAEMARLHTPRLSSPSRCLHIHYLLSKSRFQKRLTTTRSTMIWSNSYTIAHLLSWTIAASSHSFPLSTIETLPYQTPSAARPIWISTVSAPYHSWHASISTPFRLACQR